MITQLIHRIPKAELHLHIEGTFEPELMFAIAKRNCIKLPYNNIDEVKTAYQFTDLQSFLDIYYQATNILLFEEDFYDLCWAYLTKIVDQNVKHVEIFFDPQTHTNRNVNFGEVVNGLYKALKRAKVELGISGYLIACFLRDLSEKDALATFEQIEDYSDKIIGIGLDSAERNNPPKKFKTVYQRARDKGFKTVAHAGEEGSSEYIWEAINILKVDRIDHGIHSLQDPKLVSYLAETQLPLTVCPLSNVKLKVVPDIKHHPILTMLHENLCVTINSDDPAYFGGYIEDNFKALQALNISAKDIKQLAINSFNASFLPMEEKEYFIRQIDQLSINVVKTSF